MNPKVINSMNARLSRLEALLENNDVFNAQGGTTYGGLQYEGSTFNIEAPNPDQPFSGLDQQLANNYGFGPNDMVIAELQQRISELELLIAGGSNDTYQGDALDASQSVGDDGERGSGTSGGIPEGFSEIEIEVCDGTTSTTIAVIGRVV